MAGEKNSRAPRRRKGSTTREPADPGDPKSPEIQTPEVPSRSQPTEPPASSEEPEPAEPLPDRAPCPIVGVGASAGGLEALQGLFANLPSAPCLAFVVVQHRATDRASVMKSLIEKYTKLVVRDIEDGMKIEPDTIYLAPADRDVSILDAILYLVEPPPHAGVHLPIDAFFRALAQDQTDRAIGIILSGTGSDGTLGLKGIKAVGGMAMVQKADQAKYDAMPRSAIETGLVDFVLPVEEMGAQLTQYIRHPYLEPRKIGEREQPFDDQFQEVLLLIRSQTGYDFSHYKRGTIHRRLATRLAVHQIQSLDHYLKLLQEDRTEVEILARAMLITVTNFFRGRAAWESLTERVIRPLVEQTPAEAPLRAWAAGCATGEEAYTLAILFHEQMGKDDRHHDLQIFATDLDEDSINVARRGVYPKSIAADVSATRLRRFFAEEGSSYKVKSSIRESIVFSKHDLTKNAPFSRLDVVCCRNVLIYMDNSLQEKLLPMFHYALNPGGALFLGESESLGKFADLFGPVDAKHKVFRRKAATTGYVPETAEPGRHPDREASPARLRTVRAVSDIAEIAERVILRDYSWPCVLVDEDCNIVYFSGDTGKYLDLPKGKPTFNIVQMARPEIHFKLNLLLKRAFRERHTVAEKDILVRRNDHYLQTDIMVRPATEAGEGGNLMLVVFQSKPPEPKPDQPAPAPANLPEPEKEGRIRQLEQEVQSTRQYLQTTIEELETSNEELKSSNEELQSTNEELQSTNEELNTSREELQSTNEELRTVNSEYQQKIDESSRAYDDLANLLGATEVATVFLDRELKIRRFTSAAHKIFRLIDRDVGRPLDDIASVLQYKGFPEDVRSVLETLTRVEKEVMLGSGEWYEMRIFPYRTAEDFIDGVVITFVDISSQKKSLAAAERAADFAEAIVETAREPLLILGQDLKVMEANPAFYRHFQTSAEATLGVRVYELGSNQWDIPELRRLLEQIVPENTKFEGFQVQADFPKIGVRTMLLNARQTRHRGEATGRILLAFEDVTDRQQAEEAMRQSEERFRIFVTASSDVVYRMSPDWSEMRELRGREFIPDTENPSRTWLERYIDPEDQPHVLAAINEAIRTKSIFELEHRVRRVDGSLGWIFSRAVPLLNAQGEIVEWVGTANDITERKHAEGLLSP